jgi:NADPH:quinone reductase-like Zn-dependent oxidoreductase
MAGVIVSVGKNVPQQRLDKRMIALTNGGAYAQFVATAAELALPMPNPRAPSAPAYPSSNTSALCSFATISSIKRFFLGIGPPVRSAAPILFLVPSEGAGPHVKLVWTFKFIF